MVGLLRGDLGPIGVERSWHSAKTVDGIARQVDRVELDMRDSMNQRSLALDTAQSALGQLGRRNQFRA